MMNQHGGSHYSNRMRSRSKQPIYTSDKRAKFTKRESKKWIRLITVVGYIFFVSLPAISLSIYYVYIWDPHYIKKFPTEAHVNRSLSYYRTPQRLIRDASDPIVHALGAYDATWSSSEAFISDVKTANSRENGQNTLCTCPPVNPTPSVALESNLGNILQKVGSIKMTTQTSTTKTSPTTMAPNRESSDSSAFSSSESSDSSQTSSIEYKSDSSQSSAGVDVYK